MEEKYPHPKLTPKKWIENFWYYYKWIFLTVLVFLSFAVIATVQYFLKDDPDVTFLYVGPKSLGETECEMLTESAEKYILDSNHDGTVESAVITFTLSSEYDDLLDGVKDQAMQEYQGYSDEILSGDATILLLDPYFYEQLADQGALISLYEVFDELPPAAVDFYGLQLKKTPFANKDGFSALPDDTVVCLKIAPAGADIDVNLQIEIDENTCEQFLALYHGAETK